MRRTSVLVGVLVSLALAIVMSAQREETSSPRATAPLTILQLNDVYSTAPIDSPASPGGVGGLARVATLKRQIAAQGRTPFLMLAGDFLSSSVESTIFKGEQMIATLNSAGLDLATLGNHEFDFGIDLLLQRMGEAKWQWVVSNVLDIATGKPIGGAAPYVVRAFGALRVGFIGLCLITEGISRDKLARIRLVDPLEAAATYLPMLKTERVDVVIALTHLAFADDRALAERFPEIDLIVGGHEHFPIAASVNRTFISKAGSDAKFVARIDVNRRASGSIDRFYELIPITAALPDDARTAAIAKSYADRMSAELEAIVGRTRVPLDGITIHLRASETNLGNLVADAIRANAGADIAITNAGAIRGDRIFGPGPLTRRTLIEIHPFGNVVCKVAVTGRVVLDALNAGVAALPAAAGRFPQVSGLTMRIDPRALPGARVSNVRIQGEPFDAARTYTVALPDFALLGGDGYSMFEGQRVLIGPESGDSLMVALEKYLAATPDVAPEVEGRIVIAP